MTAIRWSEPGARLRLVGAVIFLIGTFAITRVCNVPRNEALAQLAPDSVEAAGPWRRYVAAWTAWNHVRTIAALTAAALLVLSLLRVRPRGLL